MEEGDSNNDNINLAGSSGRSSKTAARKDAPASSSSKLSVLQQQTHEAVTTQDLINAAKAVVNVVPMPLQQNREPEDGEVSDDTQELSQALPAVSGLDPVHSGLLRQEALAQQPQPQPQENRSSELPITLSNSHAASSSSSASSKASKQGIFSRSLRQYSAAPPSFVPSFSSTTSAAAFSSSSSTAATRYSYHLLPVPAHDYCRSVHST